MPPAIQYGTYPGEAYEIVIGQQEDRHRACDHNRELDAPVPIERPSQHHEEGNCPQVHQIYPIGCIGYLLMSKGLDRVQPRSLARREIPKNYPHRCGEDKGNDHYFYLKDKGKP